MAHEIFGNRFLDRKAAWHHVGLQNVKEKLRAMEALRKIGGDFNVTMQPLYYTTPDGCDHKSSYCQILRYPTEDDPQFAPLGQPVGMDYTPFTPRDVCEAWDKAMTGDLPIDEVFVETMGVLRRGATFFITTKLPTIGVRGDEVERYLGIVSPLDGVTALSAEEWPLRVTAKPSDRTVPDRPIGITLDSNHSPAAENIGSGDVCCRCGSAGGRV